MEQIRCLCHNIPNGLLKVLTDFYISFFGRNFKSFLEFYMSDGYPPVSPGATILTKPVPTQGFIEVDTAASPEEKHVANMQING